MTESSPRFSKHSGCLALLASLGVGLLPGPRGTYGSLLPLAAGLIWFQTGGGALAGVYYLLFVAVLSVAAVGICHLTLRRQIFGKSQDPGQIVLDEVVGMFVALWGCTPAYWWEAGLAFVLFRVFDILKPPPVSWCERLPGGLGVVADDLAAGAYALAALYLWRHWFYG